jgi:hypothetical protein
VKKLVCLRVAGALLAVLAAVLVVACGGGDSTSTVSPSGVPASTAKTTATAGVTRSISPTTATAQATQAVATATADPTAAALAAALQTTGGVTGADCAAMPQTLCVTPNNTYVTSIPGGIAVFDVNDPVHGGTGYVLALGRTEAGTWQFFLGTQSAVRPFALPGDMLVCTGGQELNVRSTPSTSASLIQIIADGTVLKGDQFLLTEPGTSGSSAATEGHGWYHINSPVDGWVYSDFVLPSTSQAQPCPS